ncbi:hypothetical protein ColLi_03757 [Colletotrichum liriopes]|uniref:Uncharacterized protein n=1 Tax=Colletotrichum liriopes TaxID=708192 RepID=A0AA37LQ78_9PEZI|nr:hypothetical protein ColLi_03757 [Colletotrichum liriopes]
MSSSHSSSTTSLLAPIARAVHRIAARECEAGDNSSRCEKPFNSPKIIGITCGITAAVLILGSLALLTFLHMRRQRFERKEDGIDLEIDGDVDDHPTMGKPPRAWQPHGQRGDDNPFEADRQPHQRENPFEPERR